MTLLTLLQRTASSLWPGADGEGAVVENGGGFRRSTDRTHVDPRYCLTLTQDDVDLQDSDVSLATCWKRLESQMALAPAGEVRLVDLAPTNTANGYEFVQQAGDPTRVESVYMDRFAVTNADFARFVEAGSYRNVDLWPAEILPNVLHFVDETRRPGPRFWRGGAPPSNQLNHPVVGVSWYEANAYAKWIGKRLPHPAEWQRAATWAVESGAFAGDARYPWGNTFEASHANTWSAARNATVEVDEFYEGCTPNGIHQLIGNVWEWQSTAFETPDFDGNLFVVLDEPMAEVRGGAFDTYFECQASSSFRSGKPLLARCENVGFRCSVMADELRAPEPMDL